MNKNEQKELTSSINMDCMDELDSWDKEIIRLKLRNPAATQASIAKEMGVHAHTVMNRLKKFIVKQTLEELQKKALDILLDAQSEAAIKTKELMRASEDDRIQLKAAEMILKGVLADKVDLSVNSFAEWAKKVNSEEE